jgi:hypothetical protein
VLLFESLDLLRGLFSGLSDSVEMRESSAGITLELDVLHLLEHLPLLPPLLVDVSQQIFSPLGLEINESLYIASLFEL